MLVKREQVKMFAIRYDARVQLDHQTSITSQEDYNSAMNRYPDEDAQNNFFIYDDSFDVFRDKVCAQREPYPVPVQLLNTGACMRAFADVLRQPDEEWLRGASQMRFPRITCPARGGRPRKQK
jgi:hypothetical protein